MKKEKFFAVIGGYDVRYLGLHSSLKDAKEAATTKVNAPTHDYEIQDWKGILHLMDSATQAVEKSREDDIRGPFYSEPDYNERESIIEFKINDFIVYGRQVRDESKLDKQSRSSAAVWIFWGKDSKDYAIRIDHEPYNKLPFSIYGVNLGGRLDYRMAAEDLAQAQVCALGCWNYKAIDPIKEHKASSE